jgi:hypothetical protein
MLGSSSYRFPRSGLGRENGYPPRLNPPRQAASSGPTADRNGRPSRDGRSHPHPVRPAMRYVIP